jgi:hypothetical protein
MKRIEISLSRLFEREFLHIAISALLFCLMAMVFISMSLIQTANEDAAQEKYLHVLAKKQASGAALDSVMISAYPNFTASVDSMQMDLISSSFYHVIDSQSPINEQEITLFNQWIQDRDFCQKQHLLVDTLKNENALKVTTLQSFFEVLVYLILVSIPIRWLWQGWKHLRKTR